MFVFAQNNSTPPDPKEIEKRAMEHARCAFKLLDIIEEPLDQFGGSSKLTTTEAFALVGAILSKRVPSDMTAILVTSLIEMMNARGYDGSQKPRPETLEALSGSGKKSLRFGL